ncbi:UNVERIFIED_CONTAM: Protein HIGH CHLOROPHYLL FLUORESCENCE PHENOTYPE chloroplastic [Sesamum indicum]
MAGSASTLSFFNSYSLYCNRAFENLRPCSSFEKRFSFTCFSSKKKQLSFMDQILDYIEEEDGVRDAVLVTDGDNEIGQMIILSLIVKRVRVKTLVKDKRVAMEAFGTYVEEGFLYNIESWKGIQHVILLSQLSVYRDSTGIQAVMNSNARKLAEQDENVVKSSGVPYSIIRTGLLKNAPGGQQGFCFEEGSAVKGSLSKEDAAFICVEALDSVPEKGLTFEVVNGAEKVSDWKKCFAMLMDGSVE